MKSMSVCCARAFLLLPLPASAQDWPTRPVRIVSPFAAGGTADILARMVADHLSSVFKQQFFVENRTGAGGAIGVQGVATSPPDGYNLVITNISMLVTIPVMNPEARLSPDQGSHEHRLCRRRAGRGRDQRTERHQVARPADCIRQEAGQAAELFVLRHRHQRPPARRVVRQAARRSTSSTSPTRAPPSASPT